MEVRITFRSEIYIKGENLKEIRDKFETIPLFVSGNGDSDPDFVELCSVEDAETYEDLMTEYRHAY